MLSRVCQILVAATLVAFTSACTTPLEATTDYDAGFDFGKVRTVAIQPIERETLSAINISDMQESRIDAALAEQLRLKGFEVVSDNTEADMFLVWHLVTEERTDVRAYNSMSYYNCWGCGPAVADVSVRQYTQGTFIVDMIDPLRNRSVWRSIIESRLSHQPDPDAGEARRRQAAAAALAEFPPR
ncbi:DUF4136 domain-containing protein [Seongchinamella sediminis]|uniref:DUF4136 domain-containing protein n=1 Tax=Seongchinamella sediminis TaxID=2283635 RepID=A0A3L7DYN9_9GAMM|nr:DUF4136 domain-containing protein [Seongchinamella sediminis]RLQ22326.1 DUF4136 domain-containing protein [Seongchinamella sediminis]